MARFQCRLRAAQSPGKSARACGRAKCGDKAECGGKSGTETCQKPRSERPIFDRAISRIPPMTIASDDVSVPYNRRSGKLESNLPQSRAVFDASCVHISDDPLELILRIDAINAIPSKFNVPFKRAAK